MLQLWYHYSGVDVNTERHAMHPVLFLLQVRANGFLYYEIKEIFLKLVFFIIRNTGGLMRPDQLNKVNNANYQTGTNYLHNKTNRFLNIVNTNSGNTNGDSGANSSSNNNGNAFAKNNFHKALRRPPKGIYLNYEELLQLAQTESSDTFEVLNRRLNSLKKEVTICKFSLKRFELF